MKKLGTGGLGIRAKLNLGVGAVVFISALAFGTLYALVERATILNEKQEHIVHVASMARLSLEGADEDTLRAGIREFNRHLSQAMGAPHHIRIEDAAGRTLMGGDSQWDPTPSGTHDMGLWHSLFPAAMSMSIPIETKLGATPLRLVAEESLENLPGDLRLSFLRHVAFAALLFGLTAFSASLLAHILVVRPVRELAAATERIGASGTWEPYWPTVRRRDEVGVLCDRFADLSRRLVSMVRNERYGSAHLVAVGLERGLEEPLRHVEMELTVLRATLPDGSDELHHCENLASYVEEIAELSNRLKDVGGRPPSTET